MIRALVVVVVALLAAPRAAVAYTCTRAFDTGPSLAWDTRTVTLHITRGDGADLVEADLDAAVRAAATTWTDVACSDVVVEVAGFTDERRAGFDWSEGSDAPSNIHLVTWRGGSDDLVDTWLHPVSALAITTVTFVRASGRILDADIEMNDDRFLFTTCDGDEGCIVRHDLQNTLVHEVGHVLGLDHPPQNQPLVEDATMYATAPEGETKKRTLDVDDENGLCAIYPSGAENGECYGVERRDPPDVTVRSTGGCGGASSSALLVPLALLVRRRALLRPARHPHVG